MSNNKDFLGFEENNHHPLEKLRHPRKWDIAEFSNSNLPVVVGKITCESLFSFHRKSGYDALRVLDMPIQFPGQGMRLPNEYAQFIEMVVMVMEHERVVNPDIDNCYAYITIDQKPVEPLHSQRRDGWHSDAYLVDKPNGAASGCVVDRTYLAYDCLPTLFCAGPWDISEGIRNDCQAVLESFAKTVKTKSIVTYPEYTVLRIDPFDVHCVATNQTEELIERTFVKIAFSYEKYNRAGNTHNPLFDYSWEMVPRDDTKREHRFA